VEWADRAMVLEARARDLVWAAAEWVVAEEPGAGVRTPAAEDCGKADPEVPAALGQDLEAAAVVGGVGALVAGPAGDPVAAEEDSAPETVAQEPEPEAAVVEQVGDQGDPEVQDLVAPAADLAQAAGREARVAERIHRANG